MSTGPLEELTDELLESVGLALAKSKHLKGTVASGDMLSRTLSVRASIDIDNVADAVLGAVSELSTVWARLRIPGFDVVELAVMRDLPEDEFFSARDDIVGTPDVADRLGISRQRVAQLVEQQGRFPTPIATVRGTHVWRWGHIADWIAAGARDMRRRKPSDNTIDLMTALKRGIEREKAAHTGEERPIRRAAKRTAAR